MSSSPANRTPPDALIIAADALLEVLGKEQRERMRLTVDGVPASLGFLLRYFRSGRNAQQARSELENGGPRFVSLNGPYLCQYLERRGLAAQWLPQLTPERRELVEALAEDPRAVILSTTFLPFAAEIDRLAAWVKERAPRTLVVAGGIQIWKSWKHKEFLDAGLIGEDIRAAVCEHNYLMDLSRPSPVDALVVSPRGEATLAELLTALRAGRDWRGLANLAFFDQGRWRINSRAAEPEEEVRVDWRRVPLPSPRIYLPIQASQGCSYRCSFCDFRGLFPNVRLRSAASVLDEAGTMPEADGVRRLYFTDDNLFTTRARLQTLCGAILRSGMRVRWRGMLRISAVDEPTAELMARSGCLEVLLGIESGDQEILRRMNKRVTPEQILRGVETLDRHGIHTKSTFIVGFPGETEASVRRTVQLLNAYPTRGAVHRYLFFTFAVLPLSEVASPAMRARYRLAGYGYHWRHATMDSAQAARELAAAQEALKPELSPSYVLEAPEVPGLSVGDLQRVYRLRNRLARLAREGGSVQAAAPLWEELEACFSGALDGCAVAAS
jgi:p-methyltransferase